MGSGRCRPDARYSQGGRAPADPARRARRTRGRVLLLALLGALALSGLVAQPALATRKVNIVFGCSKIVFEYAGFPEAAKANVVTERLRADGTNEFTEKFEFTGGEGKSEVTIPVATGRRPAQAHRRSPLEHQRRHRRERQAQGTHQMRGRTKPEFTVGKTQQIAGSSSPFTPEKLTGKLGQTVDYQITVSNTGNVALTLGPFMDPGCDQGTIAGPPEGTAVAPGGKVVYTCSHLLSGGGLYTNVASAEATYEGGKTTEVHESNKVITNVVLEARLSLSKTQEIKGSGAGFTASTLTASVGQTVLYRITAKNTGNTSLDITEFTDIYCEGISPGPGQMLAPGQSITYTCSERLTSIPEGNFYTNVAFIKGSGAEGASAETASNAVMVKVVEPGTQSTTSVPPGNPPSGNGSGTAGTLGNTGSGTTTGTEAKAPAARSAPKRASRKKPTRSPWRTRRRASPADGPTRRLS